MLADPLSSHVGWVEAQNKLSDDSIMTEIKLSTLEFLSLFFSKMFIAKRYDVDVVHLYLLSRIWLPLTTLQLHITHGLQLPSFTALQHTHSHPTLHQSHSCHQSFINTDCFTTPAPHSHTHI